MRPKHVKIRSPGLPEIQIVSEKETQGGGWSFQLHVSGQDQPYTLRLSWADYNHWSVDGTDAPHAVAEAVIRFVLSQIKASELPAVIDAATTRRRFPGADQEIPKLIRK